MAYNGHYPPSNTPSSDFSLSPRVSRRTPLISQILADAEQPVNLNIAHRVDFRGLNYVGTVDENLICAICRCAMIHPVTTNCGHTFCHDCIDDALHHKKECPVDRSRLSSADLRPSPIVIANQLDDLKAICPSCGTAYARSMLENHLKRYCTEALVLCPGKNTRDGCEKTIKRKLTEKGCLHYSTHCPDCWDDLLMADMEDHREKSCPERNRQCEACGAELLRCKQPEHDKECPDAIAPCKWMEYGCEYESKRKDLHLHADECSYKLVGPIARRFEKEINTLTSEVRMLNEINKLQERRIKFLESPYKPLDRPLEYSDLSDQPLSAIPESANPEPMSAETANLHMRLENLDTRMSQLSATMTENDARQTTMIFNEIIPMKTDLTELRSMYGYNQMHIRWLLNIANNNRTQANRGQDGRGPGGPGPGPGPSGGSDGGGSSGDSPLPARRLSDGRNIATKL